MNAVSLFCGIGGLDMGFVNSGFNIIWANDNDQSTWATYEDNHPNTILDRRDITKIPSSDIPDCDLIIGGPPCQSWSAGGSNRGINDQRGKLFYEYLRIISDKKPKVFVAENVEGILRKTHRIEFEKIIASFERAGYSVHYKLMNAANYGVPQDRKRVIIVGVRKDMHDDFSYPVQNNGCVTLSQSIGDLKNIQITNANRHQKVNNDVDTYLEDSWSPQFMSRNRVRGWDEVSYTVPATGRQAPLHPQAPKMIKTKTDKFQFIDDDGSYSYNGASLYRRLTIHECARIQTFPDTYKLYFDKVEEGYKILGNAVPVKLAECVANSVKKLIQNYKPKVLNKVQVIIKKVN